MSMKRKSNNKGADWRNQDPEFQAESGRYADPIPSRALLQETLAHALTP